MQRIPSREEMDAEAWIATGAMTVGKGGGYYMSMGEGEYQAV